MGEKNLLNRGLGIPRLSQVELGTKLNQLITSVNEQRTDHTSTNDNLDFLLRDGVIWTTASFAAATAVTIAGSGIVKYRIAGREYMASVDTTITLSDGGDVTQSKFRAWRILMLADGTTTTQSSDSNSDSAQNALLSLAQTAITANAVEIGYITATDSDSVINIGTDNTDAAGTTYVFYKVSGVRGGCGQTVTPSVGLSIGTTASSIAWGTLDFHIEGGTLAGPWGRDPTQIAADTDQAFTVADTIATLKYGAWIVCTDVAGTGVVMLAADGVPETVSAMSYATAAAAATDVTAALAALPLIFAPVGTVSVANLAAGTFTANTTELTATSVTATYADDFGLHSRDASLGSQAPTIPATITATAVDTLAT